MTQHSDQIFISRLNQHPQLRKRVETLLNVVENKAGDCTTADDAEQYVIEELRKMGNDAIHCWADKAIDKATVNFREQNPMHHCDGKKKVQWHTTYGLIMVMEQVFCHLGKKFRPFIQSAKITSHYYSMPLQRVMTDFGADHAFGQVPKKLQEHYGITAPVSSIRKTTLSHGEKMQQEKVNATLPSVNKNGCLQQIGEIDGCMLPIVTMGSAEGDKRKQKKSLHWKEACLALVHEQGSVNPKFDATFGGSVDDAGQALLNCAVAAGFGTQTKLHGVSDGALWIRNQVTRQFGTQASYLVDFYHVCEYIAAASKTCDPDNHRVWAKQQETLLKNNDFLVVIKNLKPYLEANEIDDNKAPVRACHRYLSNRTDQLDYKNAIEKGLPIGSGEIESAHRYVIQKRLKLSGAWWIAANIEPMLTLRVVDIFPK